MAHAQRLDAPRQRREGRDPTIPLDRVGNGALVVDIDVDPLARPSPRVRGVAARDARRGSGRRIHDRRHRLGRDRAAGGSARAGMDGAGMRALLAGEARGAAPHHRRSGVTARRPCGPPWRRGAGAARSA